LLLKLDGPTKEGRDAAEADLEKLGAGVLPLLPSPAAVRLSAEQQLRLQRLLPKLWKAQLKSAAAGRPIEWPAPQMKLSKALAFLRKTSGNSIDDLRGRFNQAEDDPLIVFTEKPPKSFWQAVDALCRQGKLKPYYYGEGRTLGLTADGKEAEPIAGTASASLDAPIDYAGAFRFAVRELSLRRSFTDGPAAPYGLISVEGMVEPRLKPLAYEFQRKDVRIVDDAGKVLEPLGAEEWVATADPMLYTFDFQLRFAAPGRDRRRLTSIAGVARVVLPAQIQKFTFTDWAGSEPRTLTTADLKVERRKAVVDDGIVTVPVVVHRLLAVRPTGDSFQQAALQPEVRLEKEDGSRFAQNGGFNPFLEEGESTGVEYEFVDVPGEPAEWRLVVEVPTGVDSVEVPISFRDLDLP
ncbi:MAG: hypothetical protein ACRDD1_03890, partial [Planctomycetia bacterium]